MSYEPVLAAMPQEGDFDPCFAFSVHKCGSTMMNVMIKRVCKLADIPAISVPDLMFSHGVLETQWCIDECMVPAFRHRLLYFGFRHLPPILMTPELGVRQRRFVLLVRDPRDALVSEYFSFGRKQSSHAVPKKNPEAFLASQTRVPERTIDEYAIAAASNLRKKLQAYRDNLDFDLGLIRRYEDVFFDKETFLREIFEHFGIAVPDQIIRDVAKANDIRPEKEDETKHIRKGTPGDHREKLDPETIGRLNDIFREVGSFYGYQL
jgi:hypothetical protein